MPIPLLPRELHTTNRPSSTAQWTTLCRALELLRPPDQRIVSDPYAPAFLTPASRAALAGLRLGLPAVHLAERRQLAGLVAYALCRHRFIDDQLRGELADGVEQVVLLGAGYDSRAYRFADALSGRPVHEVDLAPLSRRKASVVAAHPELFADTRIRRVEIDFRSDSLADRLLASGFAVGARTFVVWEGVSMYLDRATVCSTLHTLHELCGAGSTLATDFWYEVDGHAPMDLLRRAGARAVRLVGEPVTFGVPPGAVADLLGAHGFTTYDIVQAPELAVRYSTQGRPTEKSVYAVAARL